MYTIPDIKRDVHLPSYAEAHGVEQKGGRHLCPFHNNTGRPNLSIRPHSYRCYACGAQGDVFDFAARLYGCDFRTAVERVCDFAGLPVPAMRGPSWRKPTLPVEAWDVSADTPTPAADAAEAQQGQAAA